MKWAFIGIVVGIGVATTSTLYFGKDSKHQSLGDEIFKFSATLDVSDLSVPGGSIFNATSENGAFVLHPPTIQSDQQISFKIADQ